MLSTYRPIQSKINRVRISEKYIKIISTLATFLWYDQNWMIGGYFKNLGNWHFFTFILIKIKKIKIINNLQKKKS